MSWDCRMADCKVWTVKPPARSASVEVEVKTIEDATEITVKRKTINKEMIKETRRDKAVLCPQTRSGLKTSRLTASCLRRQPVLRLNRLDISSMPLPKSLLTLILRRGRLQAETRRPGPKGIDRKKKRRRGRGITKIETHTLDISDMPLPKSPLTLTLKRGVLLDDPTSSQVQKKRGRKKGEKIGPGITRLKIEKIGAHTLDISDVPLPKPSLKLVIRRGKLQAEATGSQGKKTRGRKKKWRRRCGVKNEGVKRERSPETEEEAEPSDNELWTSVNTGATLNERAPVDESGGVHASPHFPSSHKREEEQPIQTFHTEEHSGQMAKGQNREEVSEIVAQDSLTPEPSNTSHKIHSEEYSGQMAKGQTREELSEIVPQDSLTPEPSNTSHKIHSEEHSGQMAEGQNREELSEIVLQDSLTPEPSNISHNIVSEEDSGHMFEGQNREELPEMVPQDLLTPEPFNISHKINSEEHSAQMAKGKNREEPSEIVPQDSLTPEPSNTSHKIHSEEHSGHMFEGQNRDKLPEMVSQDLLTPEPSNTSHKINSEEHSGQMAEGQNSEEPSEIVPQDSLTPEPSNTSHKMYSEEHSGHMFEGQNRDELPEMVSQDLLTPEPFNTSHKIHSEEHSGHMFEGQNRDELPEMVPQDLLTPEPFNISHKIHSEETSGQMAEGQKRELPEVVPQDSLTPEPSNTSHKIHSDEHIGQMAEGQKREEVSEIVPQDSLSPEPSNTSHKSFHLQEHNGHMAEGKNVEKPLESLPKDLLTEIVLQHSLTPEPSNSSHKRSQRVKACSFCGKTFTDTLGLTRHMRSHIEQRSHQCTQCGQEYDSSEDLEEHQKSSCEEKIKKYSGEDNGGETVQQKNYLKRDKKPDLKAYKKPDLKADKQPDLKADKQPDLKADKQPDLKADKQLDLKADKQPDLKADKKPDLKGHKKDRSIKCHVCGKVTTRMLGLRRHLLLHFNNGAYKCPVCPTTFITNADLRSHLRLKRSCREKCSDEVINTKVHLQSNPGEYKCPYCGDTFQLPHDLKGHTKDCSRKCHVCGKTTLKPCGMRRHMLRHNNNGPYKCPVCPRTFISHTDLKMHLKKNKQCREKCSDVMVKELLSSVDGRCGKNETGVTTSCQQPSSSSTGGPSKNIEEFFEQFSYDFQKSDNSASSDVNLNSLDEDYSQEISQYQPMKDVDPEKDKKSVDDSVENEMPNDKETNSTIGLTWKQVSQTDPKPLQDSQPETSGEVKNEIQSGKLQAEATGSHGQKRRGRKKKQKRGHGVKNEKTEAKGVKRERSPETEEDAEPSDNKLWTTVIKRTTVSDSGGVSESVPQDSLTPEPSNTSHKRSQRVKACSFCRKTFTETLGLTRHMRSHIEQRSHQCTLCGQDFEFSEDLEEHQKSSCEEKKSGDDYCGETVQQKKFLKKKTDLKRDKKPDLKGDKNTHLNRAKKNHLKRDKKSDLKGHTKDGSIKCHVCGKVTTRIVSLQRHLLLHFNNGAYKCPVCPKTFILNCDLRSHLRLKRSCGKKCSDKVITTRLHLKSNPGDYKCPYCGDTFQLPPDLKGHTKDCSRKCHVCGKISSRILEMRRHMLKHKNNGPIKCPVCPKTFIYHTDLKKHLKTKKLCREKCSDVMVKDSADLKLPLRMKRSYRKTFSDDVITTKIHLKSNPGDYKCPYCGDTFQLPRDLKGHTKDCSRKCNVCGKTTSTARGMRRHMLRHNNNGPYKCPVCPRTFIYHPDLKKHLKLKKRCRAKCSDVMMKELLSSGDGRCRKMLNETAAMTNSQQPSSINTGGPSKRIEELSHDSQQSNNSMSSDMNLNSLEEDHSNEISQYQPIKDVDLSSLHEDFSDEISHNQTIKDVDQSNPGEYNCPYCGDTFQHPDDMKRHTKDCSRKCHVCGKISSKACDMRRHMLKHDNNGPIKCPVCPKTFIFHTDLKTHLKTKKLCREKCSDVMAKELLSSVDGRCRKDVDETGVMTRLQQPSSSNTGGPSKSGPVLGLKSFEEFFEELSNDSDISMSSDVNLNSLDEDYSQEISQYQPMKDVDLNSLDEDYSQEISQYQPIKDVDLNSLYEDYSLEISQYQPIKDVDQSNPGEYKCPYCGETFQLLHDLKGHKKDCSRKCHVCGKTTSTACGMRRHMLKHYNGPIKCPVCPTTFVYHTDLKKHLKTKKLCREKCSGVLAKELLSSVDDRCRKDVDETGVMASCEQPSSSDTGGFSNSIEEFSHDLQQSDNSMSSDVNLNSLHEDNIQEISQYQAIKDIDQSNPGEYKCPYCGDTFQLPDDLKGHTKDCSRKCHVCGKISSKACDMRRHMLKHYNNGPIKCLVCPKTFIFHTDLKTHLKTKKLCREKCSDVMAKELLSSVDVRCRKHVDETGVMTRLQQPSSSNTGGPSKSGPVLGLKSFEEFFEELSNDSDISMSSDVNLNSLHEDYSQEISQYQPMKDVDLNSLDEDYSQEISQYQPMKDVDLNSLHEVYSDDISQYQPVKDIEPKEDRRSVNDSGVNEMPNDKEPNSTNSLTGPMPLQDSI
uniref:C2H2-type domain-containing protein n=1 Tax=Hucho hucho TaxID=62062 RepID=A0A4W5K939_9TELE